MKKITFFVIIFILGLTNYNCHNDKKQFQTNKKEMNKKKNYYVAKIQVQACFFEVFLDDIPVYSFGVRSGMSSEIPLNNYILKSGKHLLKIKLTPMFNNSKLNSDIDLSIDLGVGELSNNKNISEYNSLGKFQLSKEIKEKSLPFYEIILPFDAQVIWDYQSIIDNAQELTKSKKLLDDTVHKFYNILQKKDSKKYYEIMNKSIEIQSVTEYMSETEKKELIMDVGLSNLKKVLPLDEYEVKFYADGKLVRFISKKHDENGNQYLFKYTVPPLMEGKHDGEGAFNYLFYLPKDKTELEVF